MINRLQATRHLVEHAPQALFVASCGNPKFDLAGAGDRESNFYMWNSMGLASSIGLGLALALPHRKVIILDGDGAILMNLGSLATAASKSPSNLVHIIWDNEQYQITGGQPSHTAGRADLAEIAAGAGTKKVMTVTSMEEFVAAAESFLNQDGHWVIVAKTDDTGAPARPPKDPVLIKHRFMEAIRRSG
ncbi:MAG: thiamine pyrophosphate-dependent enzyme [Anaerolineae bacterium]